MKPEYMSFFMLAPASLLEAAENEIQVELDRTDGELFHYQPQTFRGYNLGWPRADVQGLLQFFSDVGVCSRSIASRIHCYPTTSRSGL